MPIDRRRPQPEGTRKCRFCTTRIVFVRDSEGRTQVLDVQAPVYRLRPNEHGVLTAVRMADVYVSHWATCTGRDEAKKAQRRTQRARRKGANDAARVEERGQDVGAT